MKQQLRMLFSPVLKQFESGAGEYVYRSSHRKALIFIGCVFSGLAVIVFKLTPEQELAYFLPVLVFGAAGCLCLIIGLLGTDRAVAKIWGSR